MIMKIKYFIDVGNLSVSLKNFVNNICNLLGLKQLKKSLFKKCFQFLEDYFENKKKMVKFFNK